MFSNTFWKKHFHHINFRFFIITIFLTFKNIISFLEFCSFIKKFLLFKMIHFLVIDYSTQILLLKVSYRLYIIFPLIIIAFF